MTADRRDIVERALAGAIDAHRAVKDQGPAAILEAAGTIGRALRAGHKVLVCGNGGSAADAQHFAAELVGRFVRERRPWPALALTTDTSVLTAVANDYGFDRVFARQVEAHGQAGDVFVGISTSGASPDVLAAVEAARACGMATIGLTGRDGGALGRAVEVNLAVPSPVTARVQEVHATLLHILCELVDEDVAQ